MPPELDQRQLDEFISLLAHDLRTPLTSIRGYAQLMLRQRRGAASGGDGDEDSVAGGLKIIMEQSDRLAALTDLLLDVSRIRLGRVALRRAQVDLGAAVRSAAAALPGVRIAVDAPERGPHVDADATRVQQMVGAMLRYLAVRAGSEPLSARLAVSDGVATLVADGDGAALSGDEVDTLLYELVRPATTAAGWQLAHIELFIARGVAEAHGGALTAESPVGDTGRGVRLTLSLPAA